MQKFRDPVPGCPVCGDEVQPIWLKVLPGQGGFVGVFVCHACSVRWRIAQGFSPTGDRNLRSYKPICPTCKHASVDMTVHRVDDQGHPVSWVCWEDGTMLQKNGERLRIEPVYVREFSEEGENYECFIEPPQGNPRFQSREELRVRFAHHVV